MGTPLPAGLGIGQHAHLCVPQAAALLHASTAPPPPSPGAPPRRFVLDRPRDPIGNADRGRRPLTPPIAEMLAASLVSPAVIFMVVLALALICWRFVLIGAVNLDLLGGAHGHATLQPRRARRRRRGPAWRRPLKPTAADDLQRRSRQNLGPLPQAPHRRHTT
ncbi:hypothetical protein WMF18_14720 [Sorangium sp. So ce315]|uniref:hypothetical protein n=1 Tax=Sorangium sp. So ce315 TaxID=3133299 RepID=UPI003F62257C